MMDSEAIDCFVSVFHLQSRVTGLRDRVVNILFARVRLLTIAIIFYVFLYICYMHSFLKVGVIQNI